MQYQPEIRHKSLCNDPFGKKLVTIFHRKSEIGMSTGNPQQRLT
jgi:hypothetical protein